MSFVLFEHQLPKYATDYYVLLKIDFYSLHQKIYVYKMTIFVRFEGYVHNRIQVSVVGLNFLKNVKKIYCLASEKKTKER